MNPNSNRSCRHVVIAVLPVLATLVSTSPAIAMSVLPGGVVATSGTTAAARSEIDCTIVADTLRNFKIKDGHGGYLTGQIPDRVIRENAAGTPDFYTRIMMNSASSNAASIDELNRTNFAAYAVPGVIKAWASSRERKCSGTAPR